MVLTHIFWSQTLKGAISLAQSHCVADNFFNQTFIGEMPWKDDTLILTYDEQVIGRDYTEATIHKAIQELQTRAEEVSRVNKPQIKIVQKLSKMF